MPEWGYMIIVFAILIGMGSFAWLAHKKEEQRKEEKARRKHERSSGFRKLEKVRLAHDRKTEKERFKHELYMSGRETPAEQVAKHIPMVFESVIGVFSKFKLLK